MVLAQESVGKVVAFLARLAANRSLVENLVESSFKAITPDVIRMWVSEGVKLLPDEVRRLYFENPQIAPHTKRALIKNWTLVEQYLARPENTLKKIASVNPENKEVLEDPAARNYILGEIARTYNYLVEFARGSGSDKHTA